MAKSWTLIIAALILQINLSTAEEEPTKHHRTTTLEEVSEHLKSIYNDVVELFDKQLPRTKEVSDKIIEQSRRFLDYISSLRDALNKQIGKNNQRINETLSVLSEKLSTQINHLKEALGPNTSAVVDNIQDRLEHCFKITYHAVDKVVEAAKPEYLINLPNKAKDAAFGFAQRVANRFIETAKSLQSSLENALE